MKKIRINKKKIARNIIYMAIITLGINTFIDFCNFPEKYITTWKYQLQKEVEAGEPEAITYYNQYYIKKGVYLFEYK